MKNKLLKGYENKRVLVTGHSGFKGSWITLWLKKLGAEVVGFSLEPPTEPNLFEILNLKEKIIHFTGDIRDRRNVSAVLEESNPEIVFHLAAQPLVGLSYIQPLMTYETNITSINVILSRPNLISYSKSSIFKLFIVISFII